MISTRLCCCFRVAAPAACCLVGLFVLPACTTRPTADAGLVDAGFTKTDIRRMRTERADLARRSHRVIFNNDGCDAAYFPKTTKPTPENLLALRTTPLANTDVDTLSYCTISSGFGLFTHRTSAGEQLTRDLVHYKNRGNIAGELFAKGTDPLDIMVRFCHDNGLECFWSMRMNDTHDQAHKPDEPYPLFPAIKKTHPEYLVGEFKKRPKCGSWTSVNYALPEIRNLAFNYLEEVCRNYDVDGIELDFFRHMCYLKSVAWGGVAGKRELRDITNLIRRIRTMTENVALRRGRPIVVAVRVPDSPEYARAVGLDIETWMRENLVDIFIGSDYFKLNPWTEWAKLGKKHDAVVYAGLSESRVRGEDKRFRRQSTESYRARALRAWRAGVNGLYIFNIYDAKAPFLSEIGDPHELAALDKVYFATVRDGSPARYLHNGNRYRQVPILTPHHPWELYSGKTRHLELVVGDDLQAATRNGLNTHAACHLRVKHIDNPALLTADFNGHTLTGGAANGEWIDYALNPSWIRTGKNQIACTLTEASETPARRNADDQQWDMQYQCDHKLAYPKQLPWRRAFPQCNYVEAIQDNALLLADRDTSPLALPHLVYPWRIAHGDKTVVEARLKLISSTEPMAVCIRVADGASVEYLTLQPAAVRLHFAKLAHPIDTTDTFHTYRVVLNGRDIHVYVDDRLVLQGDDAFRTPADDPTHWLDLMYGLSDWCKRSLYIGSATGPGKGEALWEFIRFRSDTRFGLLKDVALTIDYRQ